VDTYLLLLQGINVGGHNRLPMTDLRAVVSGLGHGDVRTYLQSGNVVRTGTERSEDAADAVSVAIRDELSLTVPVAARTVVEWAFIVDHNPFAGDEDDPKGRHVTSLGSRPEPDRVEGLLARAHEFASDRFSVVGPDVYLHFSDVYAGAPLQNGVLEQRLGQVCTTRNWRTVADLG
jgi:uncharacterized protein (DUF1697 family)